MENTEAVATEQPSTEPTPLEDPNGDVVSTHVLVPQDQLDKLRELARRTRVTQSTYLREAVEDLLGKYTKKP